MSHPHLPTGLHRVLHVVCAVGVGCWLGAMPSAAGAADTDAAQRAHDTVEVEAVVDDYLIDDMHDQMEDGLDRVYDTTRLTVLSPPRYAGRQLGIHHDRPSPTGDPWRTPGAVLQFTIVPTDLDPLAGTSVEHFRGGIDSRNVRTFSPGEPAELVLSYGNFGPQAAAHELLGMGWWQWDNHGDSDPATEYPIRVVVYRDQSEARVRERFPVSQETLQDFRYVELADAVVYLDRMAIEAPQLASLVKETRARLTRVLGAPRP